MIHKLISQINEAREIRKEIKIQMLSEQSKGNYMEYERVYNVWGEKLIELDRELSNG